VRKTCDHVRHSSHTSHVATPQAFTTGPRAKHLTRTSDSPGLTHRPTTESAKVEVLTVSGFFDDAQREAFVVASMLALVWLRSIRVPSWAARSIGVLASASLYIYLIHWQVYPHLEYQLPWLAALLSLLAGVALWRCVERVTVYVARHRPQAAGGTGPIS